MTTGTHGVQPGDVLTLPEDAYKYGTGVLVLRVSNVRHDLSRYYDGHWIWLEGVQLRRDGTDGQWRQVLVWVSSLAAARTRR
jgi:hypothetical protein